MALITEKALRQLFVQQQLPQVFQLNEGDRLTPSAKDFLRDRKIILNQNGKLPAEETPSSTIPVGVSNRHIHLTEQHFQLLFGAETTLTQMHPLTQPGQFAAKETVTIVGTAGVIRNVRILGPFRKQTQIEISKTDGFTLGVHPPVRLSGTIEGTPGLSIVGPFGSVTIESGLIIAKNHVHMSEEDARNFAVNHGDTLILSAGPRALIFPEVMVRVKSSYILDFHIDQDEANAAGLKTGDLVKVIGKNRRFFSQIAEVEPYG